MNSLLFQTSQRKPKDYPFYLMGVTIAILFWLLFIRFYSFSYPCETDYQCYSECMDKGGKPEDCEHGLMNP